MFLIRLPFEIHPHRAINKAQPETEGKLGRWIVRKSGKVQLRINGKGGMMEAEPGIDPECLWEAVSLDSDARTWVRLGEIEQSFVATFDSAESFEMSP